VPDLSTLARIFRPAYILLFLSVLLAAALIEGLAPAMLDVPDEAVKRLDSLSSAAREQLQADLKGKNIFKPDDTSKSFSVSRTWALDYKQEADISISCEPPAPAPAPSSSSSSVEGDKNPKPAYVPPGGPCKVNGVELYSNGDPTASIRWDRVLLVVGGLSIVLVTLFYIRLIYGNNIRQENYLGNIDVNSLSLLEQELIRDTRRAFSRSEALFARSGLMLIAGILVAFVGISVFAFLTSQSADQSDIQSNSLERFIFSAPADKLKDLPSF
jgi:hypothetical protein